MSIYTTIRKRFVESQPAEVTDWNIRYLYYEIIFASILGGITTFFNAPLVIRLGGSEQLVALLISAPALIAALGSIPSARFMARRRKRRLWMFASLLLIRIMYVMVAAIPWFVTGEQAALWVVIIIVAMNLPAIFFTNGFQVVLGEIVPEKRRAFVFSRRSILYSLGLVLVTTLSGAWLDQHQGQFPLNYQVLYIFGFITVLGSHFFLHRLVFPDRDQSQIIRVEAKAHSQSAAEAEPRVPMTPMMRRMLLNTAVYYFGLNLPGSLFNIFFIQTLHVSDGWLGLNASAASFGVVTGYLFWERLIRSRSFVWAQRRATLTTWIFPVTLTLIPTVITNLDAGLALIMVMNFVVNMMHSGVELANLNVLLKMSKPEHRSVYVSWYNTIFFGAAFIAPLVGTLLAGPWGFWGVFLLSGVLRLAGGVLFNVYRVDEGIPQP